MKPETPRHGRVRALAVALTVALASVAGAGNGADTEQELRAVRTRIEALRSELQEATARRDAEAARLRETELERARAKTRLTSLRTELAESERRLEALRKERVAHEQALAGERERLGAALRAAYYGGGQERLRLLLGGGDPGEVARLLVYQGYLATSRAERIDTVREHVAQVARLERESAAEMERLRRLERAREEEVRVLEAAHAERAAAVAALERKLGEQRGALGELEQRERSLTELLEELRQALSDFPVQGEQPFTALRGRLAWPVEGQLLADFGELRAGARLRWNGVLLGAARGTEVHAVANGRVAFADWLPGLGLLVIVDHGDGYLSLYGHNETLNKAAGDWVRPGDVLGTVGDSGGQARPALYFEIRRGKVPQNPHPWFRKKLARR